MAPPQSDVAPVVSLTTAVKPDGTVDLGLAAATTPDHTSVPMPDAPASADDEKPHPMPIEPNLDAKKFWMVIAVLVAIAAAVSPFPDVAPWFGFSLAAYSAVANDSIQTLGTFLRSNGHRAWTTIYAFVGLIFFGTVLWSWIEFDGDVSHGRLSAKGFDQDLESVSFGQLLGPIALIILTHHKIPVSTTLLLLSSFATSSKGLGAVIQKSLLGYIIAFGVSLIVWAGVEGLRRKYAAETAHKSWFAFQTVSTGILWSVWIQQDAANIAVFLPRSLNIWGFLLFSGVMLGGLAVIIRRGGGEIQQVVARKTDTQDVRSATVIDIVYAGVLFYFKILNEVPMSTTWVFIGLLAGREISIAAHKSWSAVKDTRSNLGRDLASVLLGFVISLVLAALVNPVVRDAFLGRTS